MAQEDKQNANTEPEEPVVSDAIDGTDFSETDYTAGKIRTRSKLASDFFDFMEMLILCCCAVMFLFTFVARISTVDGSSMFATLENGDKLIVSDLFYRPKVGDIVVFQDVRVRSGAIVKRVIATEGQTVSLRYKTDPEKRIQTMTVTVDGILLDEDYKAELPYPQEYFQDADYVVPKGCLFVMGDNRNHSSDSRAEFGYVDENRVLGRVVFRIGGADIKDLFQKFGTIK